jgi:hypothetical protein
MPDVATRLADAVVNPKAAIPFAARRRPDTRMRSAKDLIGLFLRWGPDEVVP